MISLDDLDRDLSLDDLDRDMSLDYLTRHVSDVWIVPRKRCTGRIAGSISFVF